MKNAGSKSEKPLTVKAARFADAMANPSNKSGRSAAIKAGYSADTADVAASRLLTNAEVRSRIEKRKAQLAEHATITQAQILGATALRAFTSIDDAFDDMGHFDIEKARRTGAIHLVKKLSRTPNQFGESVSVEFYSNESAQDKLGSYLGMDKLPAPNPATLSDVVETLIRRLISDQGFTREEAREAAVKLYPEISNAIN